MNEHPVDGLKECPFCLEKGENLVMQEDRNRAFVLCLNCSVDMEYYRQHEYDNLIDGVTKKWNRRYIRV